MSWHLGRMCGFDLETTGIDVETDRIVTACVVQCVGGQPTEAPANWMADPGVEIPEGAHAVHGINTERAQAEGKPAAEVVEQVVTALAQVARDGIPIVTMNGSYDLTLLDREARRHGVPVLFDIAEPVVIDVRVLDKHVDQYRKGRRKLTDLCQHYKVTLDGAHSADADAIAACGVAWRMCQAYPDLPRVPLAELHELQVGWAQEQGKSFANYLRRNGRVDEAASVRGDWPLLPHQRGEQ